jgi:cell fate (sporulation/competence/biofilm development) regulator YlbF (YheA/YmcA/DUF963 family)
MNKDKIIKDLKENNRKLKNQYELQEVRLYSSQHKVDELKEENKRLNNIINELEKVIDYELSEIRKNNDYNIGLKNVSHIYKRLQELKEGK